MAIIIEQQPAYLTLPVGQEVIFSVYNHLIVTTKKRVKYIAQVYIDENPIVPSTGVGFVGTFKTTPNGAGYGMFDLSSIIESYVSADNMANISSNYKGVFVGTNNPTPLHIIDEYSRNKNIIKYLRVVFTTEYLDETQTPPVVVLTDDSQITEEMKIWNGYLKSTDAINTFDGNFGYNTEKFFLSSVENVGDVPAQWLTNAPDDRYALYTDYGVASLMSFPNNGVSLGKIKLTYKEYDGTISSETVDNIYDNGGGLYISNSDYNIVHFGCYPANIYNWSSTFKALVDAKKLASYTVQGQTSADVNITFPFTVNILCPNQKGFEPIRLTWLNQWGTWDYYTFNMKSSKSISTKGSTYEQLGGTWNERSYKPNSYKGGKKAFRVNATERVIMNTDFVNESESEWFEELINSTEVYIVNGFKDDNPSSALTTYVIPVRLQTSSYTRKTVANDKLMQYTFEVEKSKTLRTQAV